MTTQQQFTSATLLARASERLGRRVSDQQLRRAIAAGLVDRPEKSTGWYCYTAAHVEQLVAYCHRTAIRKSVPAAVA